MTSFIVFTVVAFIAHFLVWLWRPWLPGPKGYCDADRRRHGGRAHVMTFVC